MAVIGIERDRSGLILKSNPNDIRILDRSYPLGGQRWLGFHYTRYREDSVFTGIPTLAFFEGSATILAKPLVGKLF